MDENNTQLATSAERLAAAADALEKVLGRIEASQQELHAKVDRIIAAIEEKATSDQQAGADENSSEDLVKRVAEIERANAELKAQAGRLARKTLSPLVSGLLGKNGIEEASAAIDAGVLDKALAALSLEQRITVKAELARAGMIG
jgi:uncharacterized protein YhaN